jgi:hypothetical protein
LERTRTRWRFDLSKHMRENPDGFLSSRVGFAEALLSFRYMDGTLSKDYADGAGRRRQLDKVLAGETPANLTSLVLGLAIGGEA